MVDLMTVTTAPLPPAVDTVLARLRADVDYWRASLRRQHDLYTTTLERGHSADNLEPGTRQVGQELRQALAALKGAQAVADAWRRAGDAAPSAPADSDASGCAIHGRLYFPCADCEDVSRARVVARILTGDVDAYVPGDTATAVAVATALSAVEQQKNAASATALNIVDVVIHDLPRCETVVSEDGAACASAATRLVPIAFDSVCCDAHSKGRGKDLAYANAVRWYCGRGQNLPHDVPPTTSRTSRCSKHGRADIGCADGDVVSTRTNARACARVTRAAIAKK